MALIHVEIKMKPGATVTAVWREPGEHLDLFATGTDGAVWSIWWNNTVGWRPEGWRLIHVEIKMKPGATVTAVWREPGEHLDLFATGTDGAVWSIWWNNTVGWRPEGWRLIHAEIKMKPGATVTAVWREPGKHLDLFATGTDGAVWSISWNNTVGWRPEGWRLIHAEIKMKPGATVTAVWREPGKHLDLFATGTDGAVWSISWNDQPSPAWGLLANARGIAQPVKGVYFFAGERGGNYSTYTAHPLDPRDEHWNTVPSTRAWVMDRMVEAHVNTVVMSYWSNVKWSPMDLVPAEPGTEPSKIGSESLKGGTRCSEGAAARCDASN